MLKLNKNDEDFKVILEKIFGYKLKISKIKEIKQFLKNYSKDIVINFINDENKINQYFKFSKNKNSKINLEPSELSELFIEDFKQELDKYLNQDKFLLGDSYYNRYKKKIIESFLVKKFFIENSLILNNTFFKESYVEHNLVFKKNYESFFEQITFEDVFDYLDNGFFELILNRDNFKESLSILDYGRSFVLLDYDLNLNNDFLLIKTKLQEDHLIYSFEKNELGIRAINGKHILLKFDSFQEFIDLNLYNENEFSKYLISKYKDSDCQYIREDLLRGFKQQCMLARKVYLFIKYHRDENFLKDYLNLI